MSGETTTNPGKTWIDSEDLDYAKLNQTAQPTVVIDANSITSTELDTSEVVAALADSFGGVNFAFNPVLWGRYWEDTTAGGKSCPAGEYTENAAGWFCLPTGAAIEYRQEESSPTTSVKNKYAAKLVGAASCTEAEFGQYYSGDIAEQLSGGNFTFSFWVKCTGVTTASLNVRVRVSATAGDVVGSSAVSTTAVTDVDAVDGWVRREITIDGTAISNIERGIALSVQNVGELSSGTETISFTQFQLEVADAATTFTNPANPQQRMLNDYHFDATPAATDDVTLGYRPGSVLMDQSDSDNPAIYMANKTDEDVAEYQRINLPAPIYIPIIATKADGTDAGGYTTGSHVVRELDAAAPAGAVYSIASDQITLDAGTYLVDISVPCHRVDDAAAWLYDTTGTAVLVNGSTTRSAGGASYGMMCSRIVGNFTISVQSVLEVRFEASATRATDGLGLAATLGRGGEVYTNGFLIKQPE